MTPGGARNHPSLKRSFLFALQGFRIAVMTERNIKLMLGGALFAIAMGIILRIDAVSWACVVICIGCVIQGETRHFDFICQSVTQGVTELNIKYNQPVIFGVLTTDNLEQAQERAGGKLGNKGDEAAVTALQMVDMQSRLRQNYLNCYPAE